MDDFKIQGFRDESNDLIQWWSEGHCEEFM